LAENIGRHTHQAANPISSNRAASAPADSLNAQINLRTSRSAPANATISPTKGSAFGHGCLASAEIDQNTPAAITCAYDAAPVRHVAASENDTPQTAAANNPPPRGNDAPHKPARDPKQNAAIAPTHSAGAARR
jgi:hypothetical protein